MKYFKRTDSYKASNVELKMRELSAWSYGWWQFYDGRSFEVPVFNNYAYSATTQRHQWKVKRLLEELGLENYLIVETPKGLQDPNWMSDCKQYLSIERDNLLPRIKRGRGMANALRIERLGFIDKTLASIDALNRGDRVLIRQRQSIAIMPNRFYKRPLKGVLDVKNNALTT